MTQRIRKRNTRHRRETIHRRLSRTFLLLLVSVLLWTTSAKYQTNFVETKEGHHRHAETKVVPRVAVSTFRAEDRLSKTAFPDIPPSARAWADRYTNPTALREAFGSNKNSFWGDLDAGTARRLYKTLLPKALLELVQTGVEPEDLAPLAYKARVAAKLYARERCYIPSRIMATMYDGVRTLRRYGRFQPVGMSYEQLWDKYQQTLLEDGPTRSTSTTPEEERRNQISMKILESSCRTNENIDRLVLTGADPTPKHQADLNNIAQTLERDVQRLLARNKKSDNQTLAFP